jgi:mono/diheme cytochrome c family protein/glucose/arabinose dehydrogenase
MFKYILIFTFFIVLFFTGAKIVIDPTPVLSPANEQKTFVLEKGLKIQLVASEPMVQDPVCINFDEDGRLWVVEMKGYMSDIKGDNEDVKNGTVKVLEDTNGDGMMDKSTIYLDSLILPRAIALIKGGILIAENNALWQCLDTNNDLKADTKTLIDKDYAGSTAPEHAGNGLLRNLDNWYYNAKSRLRYKQVNNQWVRDSTEFRGQWGMSQDDKGRLHYNYNWSQLHADLVPPNYLSRNKNHNPSSGIDFGLSIDRRVYPIRTTPAVNRAYIPGTLDTTGRLKEFTAACSPFVYRNNLLGEQFKSNIFVAEPAGNLVKRNIVEENDLEIQATDPHPGIEFLASTDERFRPVAFATSADGALYVADMYKGIIQHKLYMTPYLKEQTLGRGLDKPINLGRIWRIVPENWVAKKPEKLSKLTNNEWVEKLNSNNGWVRDLAQKTIIERADISTEKQLLQLVKNSNELTKIHALWTLEGLNLLKKETLFGLTTSKSVLVRNNVIRLLEKSVKNDQAGLIKFQNILLKNAKTASIQEGLQIALSSQVVDNQSKYLILSNILDKYIYSQIIKDAAMSSLQNNEFGFLKYLQNQVSWKQKTTDKEIFVEMLTTAIVKNAKTAELVAVLDMINSKPEKWQQNSYLMGLKIQSTNVTEPFKLEKMPVLFAKNNLKLEEFERQKLETMFAWPGHTPTKEMVKNQIVLKPEEQKMFAKGRIQYLNTCAGCHGSDGKGVTRFAPKLAGSEWVTGNETRLALIILHGLEGAITVNGKKYDAPEILPVMPAHSTLDDPSITNILTYIRNEWGNNAGPLSRGLVGKTRHTTQGRVVPWTPTDLNKHIDYLNEVK